ncbi:MAG: tRNA glutamyl-Q(34) synthetase GluQRS [Acinetobacter sp.]|nr:tRNA glutamyl-Q(34) synthetase GluQRS [Acinetobacter sp.]
MTNSTHYIGRFAPSPTGPLHFGSLITAVASYCEAKKQQGKWFVRVEDTDIPRIYPHSEAHILACIDAFAFEYDGEIIFQQHRLPIYEQVLHELAEKNAIYACQCTRKQLAGMTVYPNLCRDLQLPIHNNAIRLKVSDAELCFDDALQGRQCSCLARDLGDFVLKRRDGIISYQLAVVVDDYLQGVTHIVRGADLLDNTARQMWLQQVLGYPQVQYCHLPLAMNATGQKLSKQNLAQALDLRQAPQLLQQAFHALHQLPVALDTPAKMLAQGIAQWDLQRVPKQTMLMGVYQ